MAPTRTEEDGFAISIPEVPVTEQRRPFIEKESDRKLKDPGTARANEAATTERPHGTTKDGWARNYKHQTVLQQHLSFFDRDADGVIWPQDTFIGFYRLGYNAFLSLLAVFIIHPGFSWPTLTGWIPDPFFRIYVERIHKDKHGSDSGSYDAEGRFMPQKFEDIFTKYAGGDKKGITLREVFTYMKGQRLMIHPFFRIYVERIHKDKHGSDSGSYDAEGRFMPQKFEDIFTKYAGGDKKGITLREVFTYMKGQRLMIKK
ncbi:related to calcium-binding protein caleosin [Phialocephala subalpina]|uniref:Related to calcium-binding protein caleosin n=1 Tax=Phialocephala subalpina TaxID=576137 RepID=A0A1L7XFV3_9HELO|nr:related to calcium-binding protein caleosin [Phialocephala subalpina]